MGRDNDYLCPLEVDEELEPEDERDIIDLREVSTEDLLEEIKIRIYG